MIYIEPNEHKIKAKSNNRVCFSILKSFGKEVMRGDEDDVGEEGGEGEDSGEDIFLLEDSSRDSIESWGIGAIIFCSCFLLLIFIAVVAFSSI